MPVDEVSLDISGTATCPHVSQFFYWMRVLTPSFQVSEDTILNHLGPIILY